LLYLLLKNEKVYLFFIKLHAIKTYGRGEAQLHVFVNSVPPECELSASQSGLSTTRGKTCLYPLGRRLNEVQHRCGRGGEEKTLCPGQENSLRQPAHKRSLE